ncbi:N-6 DNA methylase [Brucella intermedia]|uniref:site-specific DNA-methyltransferase (adenine-specific) n=2 Tax=Brucella intermedia TaxID=94625 RepID=C4WKW1_9HYPH|nr:N-6 DNA methylase [Brucella intermedia]EEQ92887.1 Type I restriction enzyme EcoEI specificity protein [Brucella intermedia LMG 3301]ELT48176.1 N-6 DNA methylase [Brucella intermedia M86]NYD80626.1 type I restriction enzyme M protein [Brucella intermedia]OOC65241.1 N-6 DNA methylase [Brucella intermedia M86]SUA87588.1 Probable type I restriction enzyme BthVORF4518P M protein [Brucella intermedia]
MLDPDTKRRIDTCRDILVGKVPDPKSQVEQITIALIYKFMDDMDLEAEELGGERRFFTKDYERYRWAKLVAPGVSGQDMLNTYSEALTNMVQNEGLPKLFRDIFRNAYLPYRDPETLRAFLREINSFTYDHSEKLGDAFEYLLSVLGSQGDAGQFRTPRHIIDFMVEIINPQKNEVIMDPACGTAGFLISAYKHILKQNSTGVVNSNGASTEGDAAEQALESPMRYPGDLLQPDDRARLARNIRGYDISPDMVRLSLVNLYLHGFADPKVEEYDTLTSEDKWTETADVILANPPFMSPKGGIKPHTRFQVQSKRSEVLFVDYIAEHLTPNGRAAIVVPEGIIFQSQSAYVALRKMLVENHLAAVISLPAGVFNPYSGVKTSILILDRAVAKASQHVAFFKIENDGFALGAQRKAVKGSQLAQVKTELAAWLKAARAGGGKELESNVGFAVERKELLAEGSITLSAERYLTREIGKSGFPMVSLGDEALFKVESGGTPKSDVPEYWDGGIPWATLVDLPASNFITEITGTVRTISEAGLKGSSAKILPANSVLVSSRATIGRIAINRVPLATNQGFKNIVIADEARVLPEYLAFAVTKLVPTMQSWATGGTFAEISKSKFCELEIPLPPLEMQREIVAEVEGYQRVIDGARAVLDNYRSYIPVDPEWPMRPLSEVAQVNPKKSELKDTDPSTPVSFVPMAVLNENNVRFDPVEVKTISEVVGSYTYFRESDVLVAKVTPCFENGKAGIARGLKNGIGFGSSEFYVVRANEETLPGWLFHWLTTPDFRARATAKMTGTGGLQRVPRAVVEEELIPLPELVVQKSIVAEIEAERALIEGNRDLITRFEKKIEAAIARVWGEAKTEELV